MAFVCLFTITVGFFLVGYLLHVTDKFDIESPKFIV